MREDLRALDRPHWARWLFATLCAWFAAPLFAPLMWRFLMVDGLYLEIFVTIILMTYLIGLPVAAIGVGVVLVTTLVCYSRVAAWPWWFWAIFGAATGLVIIIPLDRSHITDLPADEASLLALANGPVPGLAAALIFRRVLLGRRSNHGERHRTAS